MLAGNEAFSPSSFDLISSTILTGNQLSVTFDVNGLGNSYKHLQVRMVARSNKSTGGDTISYRFNGDAGSSYTMHYIQGNGSSVGSGAYTAQSGVYYIDIAAASGPSNAFTPAVMDITDAFNTVKYKTSKVFWGDTAQWNAVNIRSSTWVNTAALTSIELSNFSGSSFVAGSRFSIYGIKG
jgi:hypothetical protein